MTDTTQLTNAQRGMAYYCVAFEEWRAYQILVAALPEVRELTSQKYEHLLQALETCFKGWLALKGISDDDLNRHFGHGLVKLARTVEARYQVQLPSPILAAICHLQPSWAAKRYSYPTRSSIAAISPLDRFAESVEGLIKQLECMADDLRRSA